MFGLFSVAAVESSVMPLTLPGSTDLLLLWLVANGGEPWILAASAIAGSVLGGYSTWEVGRRGGEAALSRYMPARVLGKITRWVKRHPVLSVFLPAVLPPPIPALPFVLASGALRVSRRRFLEIFAVARALRYLLIAWLGVHYGQTIVSVCSQNLERWSTPLPWIFGALLATSILLGIWKMRSVHRAKASVKHARKATAARAKQTSAKLTR
jgi:membrane protein YqaA with SNARE-associated domain